MLELCCTSFAKEDGIVVNNPSYNFSSIHQSINS